MPKSTRFRRSKANEWFTLTEKGIEKAWGLSFDSGVPPHASDEDRLCYILFRSMVDVNEPLNIYHLRRRLDMGIPRIRKLLNNGIYLEYIRRMERYEKIVSGE